MNPFITDLVVQVARLALNVIVLGSIPIKAVGLMLRAGEGSFPLLEISNPGGYLLCWR